MEILPCFSKFHDYFLRVTIKLTPLCSAPLPFPVTAVENPLSHILQYILNLIIPLVQYFNHLFWLLSCGRGKDSPKGEAGHFPSCDFCGLAAVQMLSTAAVTFALQSHELSLLLPAAEPPAHSTEFIDASGIRNSLNWLHLQGSGNLPCSVGGTAICVLVGIKTLKLGSKSIKAKDRHLSKVIAGRNNCMQKS